MDGGFDFRSGVGERVRAGEEAGVRQGEGGRVAAGKGEGGNHQGEAAGERAQAEGRQREGWPASTGGSKGRRALVLVRV